MITRKTLSAMIVCLFAFSEITDGQCLIGNTSGGRAFCCEYCVLARNMLARKRPLGVTTGPRRDMQGAVVASDTADEAFTVQLSNGNRALLLVDDQTKVFVGNKIGSFLSVRPGVRVAVRFFQFGNALIADEIYIP
jgi:hypothetical protein